MPRFLQEIEFYTHKPKTRVEDCFALFSYYEGNLALALAWFTNRTLSTYKPRALSMIRTLSLYLLKLLHQQSPKPRPKEG